MKADLHQTSAGVSVRNLWLDDRQRGDNTACCDLPRAARNSNFEF